MQVFRHSACLATVEDLTSAARKALARHAPMDALLALGRLECALADAERGRDAVAAWCQQAAAACLCVAPLPTPAAPFAVHRPRATLLAPPPEGPRFYALDPIGFARAAQRWARSRRPQQVFVLGLRSMGSVLAPMAAAALAADGIAVQWTTLRPSGPAFHRRLHAPPSLRLQLAQWPGAFVVADEGPGLSGSSFGAAMTLLASLGVPSSRITLLASHAPTAEQAARLRNPFAAAAWPHWNVLAADPLPEPAGACANLSGGAWRARFGRHPNPPVWGTHSRLLFLADHGRNIVKFAGLGAWGRATRARARRLARAGFGPRLASADEEPGWVRYRVEAARPCARPSASWANFAGRYLAWVASEFRLARSAPPTPELVAMAEGNFAAITGAPLRCAPALGPRIALDGRMLPQEWGETAAGWIKFDGTDHGDDPFFPGPADIAWDLAAIGVEFGPAAGAAAAAAFRRSSGETERALAPRLAWHAAAYIAFRHAYCALAAEQAGDPDAAGFRREANRYRLSASRLCREFLRSRSA